jgi:hypothetical protein
MSSQYCVTDCRLDELSVGYESDIEQLLNRIRPIFITINTNINVA